MAVAQGWMGEGDGELLVEGYRVSVTQDEEIGRPAVRQCADSEQHSSVYLKMYEEARFHVSVFLYHINKKGRLF